MTNPAHHPADHSHPISPTVRNASPRAIKAQARQDLGRHGEDLAQQWYVERGYQVLARNWRCHSGELDLVLTDNQYLVFCEVKTRSTDCYGSGFEAVTADKRKRIRSLALEFLRSNQDRGVHFGQAARNLRFDVVSIVAGEIEVMLAAF